MVLVPVSVMTVAVVVGGGGTTIVVVNPLVFVNVTVWHSSHGPPGCCPGFSVTVTVTVTAGGHTSGKVVVVFGDGTVVVKHVVVVISDVVSHVLYTVDPPFCPTDVEQGTNVVFVIVSVIVVSCPGTVAVGAVDVGGGTVVETPEDRGGGGWPPPVESGGLGETPVPVPCFQCSGAQAKEEPTRPAPMKRVVRIFE